jgi:hypothetical protein
MRALAAAPWSDQFGTAAIDQRKLGKHGAAGQRHKWPKWHSDVRNLANVSPHWNVIPGLNPTIAAYRDIHALADSDRQAIRMNVGGIATPGAGQRNGADQHQPAEPEPQDQAQPYQHFGTNPLIVHPQILCR